MKTSTIETEAFAARKILVLGGTGPTGRHIIDQAKKRGHKVTALVRDPKKAASLKGVELIVGNTTDEMTLRKALKGHDAVISALGTPASPFREVIFLSAATRALINAMKAEHVSRLVAITGIGAGDSNGHGGFIFDNLIFPLLLRKVYADKNRQENLITNSGLDWTIVRPSILNNKQGRGRVRTLTDLTNFHGGNIAREDVARFVLDQLTTEAWLGKSPLVTW